jgi:putative cell wall-binding protein
MRTTAIALILAAAAVAIGAGAPPLGAATASTDTAEFAYAQFSRSHRTPDTGAAGPLHVVNAAGDTTLNVGVPATAQVAMNADGQIAFAAPAGDWALQVYTVNPDGSDLKAVTPVGYGYPVWSPDGSRLAVIRCCNGSSEPVVAVVDVRAGDAMTTLPVDQTPGVAQSVSGPAVWAPDGSKLAFTAFQGNEGSGGTTYIHIANADGSATSTLARYDFGDGDPGRIAWSPDGQSIAFAGGELINGSETYGVFVASLNGTFSAVALGDAYIDALVDGYSADGTRILAHQDLAFGGSPALFSIRADAGGAQTFAVPGVASAAWAPDGRHVVYCQQTTTDNGGVLDIFSDLYLFDTLSPSTSTRLTTSQEACDAAVEPRIARYAGATRVETSISLSRQKASAAAVVIARSDLFPDALAAAPLAAKVDGSLLLSPPSGLTPALEAEVKRLGATTAYVIGDTTALSSQVDADLRNSGVTTITRIGGATRYDTAALIAQRIGGSHVFVARGDDWADAASVSQLAATLTQPILLTPKDSLDPAVSTAFANLHVTLATIVGGPAAVAASVEAAINSDDVATARLAGADRFATSVAVVQQLPGEATDPGVTLVSGRNWPDAIAAGPSASHPMVLVDPLTLANSAASKAWLESRSTSEVVAVGGADVVSANVVANALTNP